MIRILLRSTLCPPGECHGRRLCRWVFFRPTTTGAWLWQRQYGIVSAGPTASLRWTSAGFTTWSL